ncbi:Leucine-rich repeat receptor-like protein kinase PXC1 [Carex littledalei]|uniref:Leucine-rich repeat receptor-like protein kinase PXC1 n=1 Tax=Carex littledalei TaxID=544730 RepID=A0A833VM79_9POAL|nr:Leucine-rich repeat receptor-like protein kinase PXC1 [Carex littledalei]
MREEGTCGMLFDLELLRYKDIEVEMVSMLNVSLACVNQLLEKRPTNSEVVKLIEGIRVEEDQSTSSPSIAEIASIHLEKKIRGLARKKHELFDLGLVYIQQVLATTLQGRGDTFSSLNEVENIFLYCMLYMNNQEPHLQPHLGYYLDEDFVQVVNELRPTGVISIGRVITKIARALELEVGPENAVVVPGPTTLDSKGLVAMKLIRINKVMRSIHIDSPGLSTLFILIM